MANDFVLNAKITADSNGFTSSIDKAQDSLSGFDNKISKATESVKSGAKDWGLNLDTFYEKGNSIFKSFGLDIDKFASHFGVEGKLLAGIVAVTTALDKLGEKMDETTAIIAKGTGATGESLKSLEQDLQSVLIGGIKSSTETISGVLADLNTRFGMTGKELQNLTDKVDTFANITGTDARQAVDSIADVTKKWGLNNEQIIPLMNQLTKASQMSGASVTEISNALISGQSVLSQFGMSVTDSIAFLSNMSQNGIDASNAIFGMRTALANFSKQGLNAEEEFKRISEEIKNASTETEALQLAVTTFGSRSGPELVQVFRNASTSVEDFTNELYSAGNAMKNTEEASDTVSNSISELKNALLGTFGEFGQGISAIFKTIIDVVTSFVQMMAPIITPIGAIFRDTFSFIAKIIKLFVTNLVEFHNRYNLVFKSIANIMNTVKNAIHKNLENIFKIFKNVFGLIFAIIDGKWALAWEYTKNTLLRACKVILDNISTLLNAFKDMINGIIDGINFMISGVNKLAKVLGLGQISLLGNMSEVDLATVTGLTDAIEKSEKKIQDLSGETSQIMIGDLDKVKEENSTVADSILEDNFEISENTEDLAENLKTTVKDSTKDIKSNVESATKDSGKSFENLFKKIKDVFGKIKNTFSKFGSMFSKLIEMNPDELTNSLLEFSDKILTFFVETLPQLPGFFQAGANIFSSLIDGMFEFISGGGISQIFKILFDLLDKIISFVTSEKFMNTLSSLIIEVIPKIINFVASNLGNILSSMIKLATQLVSALVEALFHIDWIEVGKAIIDAVVSAIKSLISGVGNIFKSIGKGIAKLFGFATGVNNAPSGLAVVGEQGPELVDFKGGERVYNASNTKQILSGAESSGGNNFNVTFNNIQDTSAYTMMKELKNYQRQIAIKGVL